MTDTNQSQIDTSNDPNFNTRHPNSRFQAEYPYNQSTISRSGHEIHINDTPGSESIKIAHTQGTYIEIGPNGDLNQTVKDKANFYFADGHTTTIDGHKDEKILGAYALNIGNTSSTGSFALGVTGGPITLQTDDNFLLGGVQGDLFTTDNLHLGVGGNYALQVDGNVNETVIGDSTETILGDKTIITPIGMVDITGGTVSIDSVTDDVSISAMLNAQMVGNVRAHVGSPALITIITPAGVIEVLAGGAISIQAGAAVNIQAGGAVNVNAGGAVNIAAAGPIAMTSGTSILMTAPVIKLN